MSNVAKDILIPSESDTFRIVFLYVGQGDSTLLVVPDDSGFKYALVDHNIDKKAGGIDVKSLLKNLLDDGLDVFINTHPHNDHIEGIQAIHEETPISEVWHSGHKPGKEHDGPYQEMREVIDEIGDENEYVMFGSKSSNRLRESDKETVVDHQLGKVDFQILSPAEYVADDIENEKPQDRYNRIHEHCAVIKLTYGSPTATSVLITGDSDRKAWEDHITEYHKESLTSSVLRSAHHGSRTFFKHSKEDETPYEAHIEAINPVYVVVSAPTQKESRHDHPHDEAMELYKKHLSDEKNLLHLGENRECVIVDIRSNGDIEVKLDQELVKAYGFGNEDDGGETESAKKSFGAPGLLTTRFDKKPMG